MPAIIRVVDGRTIIKVGENTATAAAAASLAEQYANDANLSADAAALAAAAVGVYTTVGDGEAATTNGQSFYVASGGTVTLYINNAGTGDEVASLVTAAALASTAPGEGAALVNGIQIGIGAIPESLQIMVRRQGIYPEQFGAKGDGVTDDLAAILLARDAVLANPGTPLVFQNTSYAVSGTVDLTGVMVVQSRRALIVPTFDGIAVKYDPGAAALLQGPRIEGDLAVQWATADWTKDRVGFYLSNVYSGEFGVSVSQATRGIILHGNTKGCVYNRFHIRELHACNVSAWLSSETAAGWSNANEFLGGRWYGGGDVTGALFEAEAGHIYFDDSLYRNNGNRFLDNSLEWNGAGFRLARMGGLRNRLAPKYCELDNGDTTWMLDIGTENTIDVDNVPYIGGYDPTISGALNRLDVSGATRPHVIGTSEFKEAQNQTQYFETTSLTGPVIRARNKSTGAGLAARTSSPSNFAIVAEHLDGTLGVGISAAGVWLAKRNATGTIERKIDWNSGINSPPSSGTWRAGDIVRRHGAGASTPVLADVCISAGTPGGWRAKDWIVIKGTTAGRPTLLATDIGVEYLDTTLAAAGKPIWWTGTDWVDATGVVV